MLIIDGHNLIGALPDEDLANPDDEIRLLARLRSYRSRSGQKMLVFFDSGDLPAQFPDLSTEGVQVRFAAPGQSADDAIIDFLSSRQQPGQYAVVTNDQGLRFRAARAGASVQLASDFARRLARQTFAVPGKVADSGPDPRATPPLPTWRRSLCTPAPRTTALAPICMRRQKPGSSGCTAMMWRRPGWRRAGWVASAGSAGLAPLRDALTHGDAGVRRSAVIALADLGERAVIVDLAGRLAGDPASMVREAAAEGLGPDRRPRGGT